MSEKSLLTVASTLSVILFLLHLTDDIIHGMEPGGLQNLLGGTAIMLVWLYATLVLGGRRSGYVIMLLMNLLAAGVPVLHMRGAGLGGAFAKTDGAFFFIGTLLALALSGTFACVLAARGLWSLRLAHRVPPRP